MKDLICCLRFAQKNFFGNTITRFGLSHFQKFCAGYSRLLRKSNVARVPWKPDLTNQLVASSWIAPCGLGPVGSFRLWNLVGHFNLCINKRGLVPFSHCKCGTFAQTGDSVVSECHRHWALQGVQYRTVLVEKINGCGLVYC